MNSAIVVANDQKADMTTRSKGDDPMPTRIVQATVGLIAALLLIGVTPAWASPEWDLRTAANSTAAPGETFTYGAKVRNVGDTPASGVVTLDIRLPDEITASSSFLAVFPTWSCTGDGPGGPPGIAGASELTCSQNGSFPANPADFLPFTLEAQVAPDAGEGSGGSALFEVYGPPGDPGGEPSTRSDGTPCDAVPPGQPCAEWSEAVQVSSDAAQYGIDGFDSQIADASGELDLDAAGHPYSQTASLSLSTMTNPNGTATPFFGIGENWPVAAQRHFVTELPPGVLGDVTALPTCDVADLVPGTGIGTQCAPETQVGEIRLNFDAGYGGLASAAPVFNLNPGPGTPAQFGFTVAQATYVVDFSLRDVPEYALNATMRNNSQAFAVTGAEFTVWGVPGDPSHDLQRACPGSEFPGSGGASCVAATTDEPLLRNPTSCGPAGDGILTRAHSSSWTNPGAFNEDGTPDLSDSDWKSASSESHEAPGFPFPPSERGAEQGVVGCEQVPVGAEMTAVPSEQVGDVPTGLDVHLEVPNPGLSDPDGIAASDIKSIEVELPAGVAINPAQASGLGVCSPTQYESTALGDPDTGCPDNSKIGTGEVVTPILEETLEGSLYVAEQENNPFGSLLALYLVIESEERGILIKQAGEIELDPDTGQITTTFDDLPQMPFESFDLSFKQGERAPLVTPQTCGTHETKATFTPWSDPEHPFTSTSSFEITEGPDGDACVSDPADRPFSPKMKAGVTAPVAGSYSPFVFQLTREDGEQEILSTTVNPPQGLTAKLAGIPYCSEADIAADSCGEESRIGTEIAGAGAGNSPFYTTENPGAVYLAGPYKGAPLSMVIQEPVIAGPFDLDDISVRAAIHVDPRTAQLTVISDEIPQINSGIPLRVRDLRIRMDRDEFTIAPTNCEEMTVDALVKGSHGAEASLTNRFQVGECASLGFGPKLKLDFGKAKKNTKPNAHPPLNAKLSFNEGDSNISSVQVALPQGVLLDQERLGRICSRANYEAGTCPEESRVGYAKAATPLLSDPVEGPVYLKASDNPLPDLAADLDGQIDIDLFGMIDQKENKKGLAQIRNTFDIVPDVPVSDFELRLDGGSDGLLVNSRNICRNNKSQRVSIDMAAHNEMTSSSKPLIGSACKQLNKKKAKKLKKKAKKLQRKAKRANSPKKAKQLRKQARKLKKQAKKIGR